MGTHMEKHVEELLKEPLYEFLQLSPEESRKNHSRTSAQFLEIFLEENYWRIPGRFFGGIETGVPDKNLGLCTS